MTTHVVPADIRFRQLGEAVAFGTGLDDAREGEVHVRVAVLEVSVERLAVLELDESRMALGRVEESEWELPVTQPGHLPPYDIRTMLWIKFRHGKNVNTGGFG